MKHIEKKILPEYFRDVVRRRKTFEIRKDDSDYNVGDILELYEWDGEKKTGHKVAREITYILRDAEPYGLQKGYCILAIQPIGWDEGYYAQSEINITNNGSGKAIGIVRGGLTINVD